MTKDTVKINKVEITIGKEKLHLTMKELRELKAVLDDLFPDAAPAPIIIERPYWIPHYREPVWPHWTVTCQNDTVALCAQSTAFQG